MTDSSPEAGPMFGNPRGDGGGRPRALPRNSGRKGRAVGGRGWRDLMRSRPGPLGAALAVLGLLLWAKLLLVTNHPRTAVARPSPGPGAATASAGEGARGAAGGAIDRR
jgi:hypothetical protein